MHNQIAIIGAPKVFGFAQLSTLGKRNIYYGGNAIISGITTINNITASRKVRLFDEKTGLFIAEKWSDIDGKYKFNNLDKTRKYFAVAHDHLQQYNAVISDRLLAQT